jgi:chromatin remodeling complex protein RSC6
MLCHGRHPIREKNKGNEDEEEEKKNKKKNKKKKKKEKEEEEKKKKKKKKKKKNNFPKFPFSLSKLLLNLVSFPHYFCPKT